MSLSRYLRKAIESGSASYGVVEANHNGFITVQVIGSDQRLTNLDYIGAYEPVEGAKVILDYSAGTKPVVRPIEQEQIGTEVEYEMKPVDWIEEVDPGILVASVDVGMGCTVNANGFFFPNEPHDPHDTWIQHWGYNVSGWTSSVYDTMSIYGEPILVGQQYFNITVSGKYLLTFHTSLHLAGGSYSGDPYGTLTAFVYRYGSYGPFPIMVGRATAAGYNDYYDIDISKLIYLPQGDQVFVELSYTAGVNGYALKHSNNPLKWLAAENDLIFKIQLLAETYIVEPPPEIAQFTGTARRVGTFGTIVEQGMDTSTKELTEFSMECTDVTETQNGVAHIISDDDFIYGICNDQLYGQYQMWKLDPDEGTAITVEVADGSLLEQASRIALANDEQASFLWHKLYSWSGSPDATAMTADYRYMDWSAGQDEEDIETLESHDVPWCPPLSTADWNWGQQTKTTTGILGVEPFRSGEGNVASYGGTDYVIGMAVKAYRTASYSYYCSGLRWRFYDVSDATYVDLDHTWTNTTYGIITNTGWLQYDNQLFTFVCHNTGVGNWKDFIEVHIVDLEQMTLTVHDVTSDIEGTYTYLEGATFDYLRGRMYAVETEDVVHSSPHGDGLIYWDVEDQEIVIADENAPGTGELPAGYNVATNKYNVYGDRREQSTQDYNYFNAAITAQEIEIGELDDNEFICPQISSDEDRIWVLNMEAGDRSLVGYHRILDERTLSLENTAIGDLPGVTWSCRINLVGNAFIITLDHDTQGTHWYIVKPRI